MTQQPEPDVTVRDNPEERRFEVLLDGSLAGFSQYLDLPDSTQRIFFHTEIPEELGGRGLAGILTREALMTTVAAGRRIVPVCPYVKKWLTTHHEVDDSVDAVHREHIEALR